MAKIRIAFGNITFNYGMKIKKIIPPIYRYYVEAINLDNNKLVLVFKKSFNEILFKALLKKLSVIVDNKYNYFNYKKGSKYNFVILTKTPEVISDEEIKNIEREINIAGDIF